MSSRLLFACFELGEKPMLTQMQSERYPHSNPQLGPLSPSRREGERGVAVVTATRVWWQTVGVVLTRAWKCARVAGYEAAGLNAHAPAVLATPLAP